MYVYLNEAYHYCKWLLTTKKDRDYRVVKEGLYFHVQRRKRFLIWSWWVYVGVSYLIFSGESKKKNDLTYNYRTREEANQEIENTLWRLFLCDMKGGAPDEWPEDLRVQERIQW